MIRLGEMSRVPDKLLRVHLVFGQIKNLLWQIFTALGKFDLFYLNGQILKKRLGHLDTLKTSHDSDNLYSQSSTKDRIDPNSNR